VHEDTGICIVESDRNTIPGGSPGAPSVDELTQGHDVVPIAKKLELGA
jgi:hypothetical protein